MANHTIIVFMDQDNMTGALLPQMRHQNGVIVKVIMTSQPLHTITPGSIANNSISLLIIILINFKGTVPPSSGARISRLTQEPLMSSCTHFR